MKRRDDEQRSPVDDERLFAELSRPATCPDLTRTIMGRLGYMRVAPAVARRRRIRRWAARGSVLAMTLLMVLAGIAVFNQSDAVRRPHEVTLPAALSHDVEQQQQRFGTLIRVLQDSTPKHERTHLSLPVPVSADEREHDADREPAREVVPVMIDDEDQFDEPAGEPMHEIDQPAVAPVRWV
jgi:hypothetical protein